MRRQRLEVLSQLTQARLTSTVCWDAPDAPLAVSGTLDAPSQPLDLGPCASKPSSSVRICAVAPRPSMPRSLKWRWHGHSASRMLRWPLSSSAKRQ